MRRVAFTLGRHNKDESNIQKVSYFYAFTDNQGAQQLTEEDRVPIKRNYRELLNTNSEIVAAFNYTPDSSAMSLMGANIEQTQGNLVSGGGDGNLSWGVTTQGSSWDTLTVLRREVWEDQGQVKGEKYFSPIIVNKLTQNGGFVDYNVANNRTYQYIFYPFLNAEAEEGKVGWSYSSIISTKWDCWSLTELHPTDDKYTFEANTDDVWLFKYNLTPTAQKHNFMKSEQKNLSAYPRFSLGTQNNMSGDVSCLLGSEFISQNFLTRTQEITVEKLYSVDENLIYWVSNGFCASRPNITQNQALGVYSFGNNQVIFWCSKKKQGESQDINTDEVQGALKTLLFNYYGSISYFIDEGTEAPIFHSANFISRTTTSTNTTALRSAWSRERKLMNSFYFWSVPMPYGTSVVPTLTPLASLYYATPGYQLGEPYGNSSDKSYGVYLKRYISEKGTTIEELVFWFKKNYTVHKTASSTMTLNSVDKVKWFLAGKTAEQTAPFTANGYFQNSNLRNLLNNTPQDIVHLDTRPTTGELWKDAYDAIMPDEHTYAHFYGFCLDESIPGTSGKIEKLKLSTNYNSTPYEQGGYIERLPFNKHLTSNESVDMLNAWRKVCYSGNPKLLKDNKGQKFLVQITSSSNTPSASTGQCIPDKIDFSWVEIGSADNIVVTGRMAEV